MRLERIWAQQEKDRLVAEALAKFAAILKSGNKAVKETKKEEAGEAERKAGQTEVSKEVAMEIGQGSKTERKKTHAKMAVKKLNRRGAALK